MAQAAAPASPRARSATRLSAVDVVAVILGNALEFYDFTVYGAFAVMIGKAFFPADVPGGSLLLSVATFGVGFVTRPLGGIIIGAYADRRGRKAAMTLTIWLMALGSGMVAILPGYATIGWAAPALLVVARLIQGFSAGGEMGPATTYLVEAAPSRRRAFYGAWQLASQNAGALLSGLFGFLLAEALPKGALEDWAWRVPFLIGILIAPVGLRIRNRLDETLDTKTAHASTGAVLSDLFRHHVRPLALGFLLIPGGTVAQYFLGGYTATYAITTLHMPTSVAMLGGLTVGVSGAVFSIVGGMLGDRFGAKAVALWPRVLLTLLIYPAVLLVVRAPSAGMLLGVMALLMALQAMSGAMGIVLIPRSLPAAVRTAGLSIAYALAVTLFGGTAQVVFTWAIQSTGDPLSPLWWVIAINIVTILATLALRPLPDEAGAR
ncbi:MFS transporter [Aliidongia dinghuensis]|uniref:MFS transporter n=1 Tax=Aliidongia dinghuensis TaxID=1867774 RepID=A0A8J3E662_9PROT|nr:MFS transporter [Aliidongia dinghuensis]GGF38538.1 MFS transporter [Aliidongia dinghuensis]